MIHRSFVHGIAVRSLSVLGISIAVALLATTARAADGAKPSADWKLPRTLDGAPDLQGNWTNVTLTTMERPSEYGDRRALTAQEAQKIEGTAAAFVAEKALPTDPSHTVQDLPKDCGYGFSGTNCGYNNFWVDRGTQVMTINGEQRSSIITEPVNGKVPQMTAEGRQRATARMAAFRKGAGAVDGPELRSLGERCLLSFGSSAGPPMLPLMYNNTYSIVQNRDTVMILVEMVHDARIIRIGGQHLPTNIRKWMGDSVGRWEGDTLVVETTNFHSQQSFRGASEHLKVVERFTRSSPDKIVYQFTVDDPTSFAKPWGGEVAMNATSEKLYEYACHEGNYALPGILAGAREEERVAAASGTNVKDRSAEDEAKGE